MKQSLSYFALTTGVQDSFTPPSYQTFKPTFPRVRLNQSLQQIVYMTRAREKAKREKEVGFRFRWSITTTARLLLAPDCTRILLLSAGSLDGVKSRVDGHACVPGKAVASKPPSPRTIA